MLAGARQYSPAFGRWVTPDPSDYASGPNLYAYCAGNPVGHSDPSGLDDGLQDKGAPTASEPGVPGFVDTLAPGGSGDEGFGGMSPEQTYGEPSARDVHAAEEYSDQHEELSDQQALADELRRYDEAGSSNGVGSPSCDCNGTIDLGGGPAVDGVADPLVSVNRRQGLAALSNTCVARA